LLSFIFNHQLYCENIVKRLNFIEKSQVMWKYMYSAKPNILSWCLRRFLKPYREKILALCDLSLCMGNIYGRGNFREDDLGNYHVGRFYGSVFGKLVGC